MGLIFLLINCFMVNAQIVSKVQDIDFGKFIIYGQGGTLSVSPNGIYNFSGNIIQKSIPTPASFDLYIAAGKKVQMTYNKNVILNGPNGGKITFELTDSSPTGDGVFFTGTSPTRLSLGGTLTIGSPLVTPVGLYSGFVQVSIMVNN